MRTLFFYLALTASLATSAQENINKSLLGETELFKNLKFTGLQLNIAYMNGVIKNENMGGAQMSALAVFNDCYATGFCFEGVSKRGLILDDYKEVINPNFSFNSISWRNEFFIANQHILNISFPIDLGVGMSDYSDDYYTTENESPTIVSSTFFAANAGLNLNVRLFEHTSLCLGARYRYVAGVNRIGDDADYTNYSLNSGIRYSF